MTIPESRQNTPDDRLDELNQEVLDAVCSAIEERAADSPMSVSAADRPDKSFLLEANEAMRRDVMPLKNNELSLDAYLDKALREFAEQDDIDLKVHYRVPPKFIAAVRNQRLELSRLRADRPVEKERIYPCDLCPTMRTKAEGGTTFTVCEACWKKLYPSRPVENSELREEREMLQLIDERDASEEALSQAFYLITGRSPEWSNEFGHTEALDEIDNAQKELRAEISRLRAKGLMKSQAEELLEVLERHPEEWALLSLGTFPALRRISGSGSQ